MSSSPLASPSPLPPATTGTKGGEVQLRGPWLRVLQVLWLLLVLDDLSVLIVGVPAFYTTLHRVCPASLACVAETDQLTAQSLAALQGVGISLQTYALAVFLWDLLTSLIFLLVGTVIFWRRANTWMGLFASFFLINLGSVGLSLTHVGGEPAPPVLLSILWEPLQILEYLCLAFFLFTFPDGRLVPRWSWVLIGLWFANTVFWVAPVDSGLNINSWSPIAMYGWLLLPFGGSVSTQVYRYLRVASPLQRQQIKWLIYGFTPILLLPILFALVETLFPSLLLQTLAEPLYRFYYLPIPVCVGIALLRYRLWDIDVLINRTLVYSLLTAILLMIYLTVVFAGEALVANVFDRNNRAVLVVSTLIVAALFQPLRRRVQQLVDHRFYRSKYDASGIIAAFHTTLRQEVHLDQVCEQLLAVVQQTMHPAHLSLWLCSRKQRDESEPSDTNLPHV